ncbi:hypothetical protein DPMN_145605 [Dreissena polymorpha]|uniref:Uncharacterized protein n=1 Tax=Dreissena polymorpha TaxID=45954 RepID=A0A9D4F4D3_DREPO|nr:hypothetical protein DPMN_145605 [Dreissena polymorpha]
MLLCFVVRRCAVSPTGDKLYITDWYHHRLNILTRDGTPLVTFAEPELERPSGIHVTPAGQVLVCGCLSHTIQQVDCMGRTKLASLVTLEKDGVGFPLSVYYSSTTSSIIVGQQLNDNKIMVFRVDKCVYVCNNCLNYL